MKRLWTIMRKEVRHILRDPLTLLLILALPASLLVLLGYGITGESSGVTLAIVDFDKATVAALTCSVLPVVMISPYSGFK